MDVLMAIISFISMVASIISCIFAVKAKNEAKNIVNNIKNENYNLGNQEKIGNKGDMKVENAGKNNGVIGGNITGGVNISDKE